MHFDISEFLLLTVDQDHKWMKKKFAISFMKWSVDRHIGFQDSPIIICENCKCYN